MNARRITRAILLSLVAIATGCGSSSSGGLTAQLVIDERPGTTSRGLRAAEIAGEIERLEITALTAEGSTLAKTVLALDPSPGLGELLLDPMGGEWSLDDVEAGTDRVLRARAFLSTRLDPSIAGRVGFAGSKTGIAVVADQVQDVGTVTLTLQPGIRLPRLDDTPPGSPGPVTATSLPAGGALDITWTRPRDEDVSGYLVAITDTATAPVPMPDRAAFDLSAGAELAPGVRVLGWFLGPTATRASAAGLVDGRPYRIFVYAYDATFEDTPLNFSRAAETLASTADSDPPGSFADLRLAVDAMDADRLIITFVAPGEDTVGGGAPTRYEVRTSTVRDALTDAVRFEALPRRGPPPVVAPGGAGMFARTFSELDQRPERAFFLGIRAIDEADNAGPVGVIGYSVTATMAPTITRLAPEIGIAGQPLAIEGRLLGPAPGTVTLVATTGTVTTMTPLTIGSWRADRIQLNLPATARSGTLVVSRTGDAAVASAELPVLVRLPPPAAVLPPFAISSAPLPGRTAAHAVYEAIDAGATVEHGIRRIIGETTPLIRHAPFLDSVAPAAIGGTYSGLYDRFAFVAAGSTVITAGLVSTATVPAELRRTVTTVANADGVGLALLAPTSTLAAPNAIPALFTFSVDGRIRTATVADLATDAFGPFTIVTSSNTVASGVQLVHVATSTTMETTFLGYREGTGLQARLGLMSQMGSRPGGFIEDAQSMGPLMAERFVMLEVPTVGLVIAYEHRRGDGTIETRVMMQRFFGLGPGFSPFARTTVSRRLEDAGLVYRGGRVWIALATTTEEAGGSRQLNYAEIDPRLALADGYGVTEGVRLDIALANNPMRAQLGGKPTVVEGLPLIWNGARGAGEQYLRR